MMMEVLLSLAVWIGIWVLVVKKRGSRGKLVSNLLGAALGMIVATVLIAILAPELTPEQIQAREAAERVAAEERRTKEEVEAKAKAEAEKNKDRSVEAAIVCSNYVERSLKSPASADFPLSRAEGWTRRLPEQAYMIRSYVDSQNSFGAMIRTWYVCGVQYLDGDPILSSSWSLKGLDFEQ